MEIQDIGLTDGSVTCKMVTYMSNNLARTDPLLLYCKASFFSHSSLFSPGHETLSSDFSNSVSHQGCLQACCKVPLALA